MIAAIDEWPLVSSRFIPVGTAVGQPENKKIMVLMYRHDYGSGVVKGRLCISRSKIKDIMTPGTTLGDLQWDWIRYDEN